MLILVLVLMLVIESEVRSRKSFAHATESEIGMRTGSKARKAEVKIRN